MHSWIVRRSGLTYVMGVCTPALYCQTLLEPAPSFGRSSVQILTAIAPAFTS